MGASKKKRVSKELKARRKAAGRYAKYKNKQKMKFFENQHKYINDKGEDYRSVTGILKSLEHDKDWNKIAEKYAKKHGLKVEDVIKAWDHERDISIVRGKKLHATEESKILNSPNAVVFSEEHQKELHVRAAKTIDGVKEQRTLKLEDGIYPELMVWLDSAKIAGQIDKCIIANGQIFIDDHKTNKKIDKESFKNWAGQSEKLKFPCAHLDACNFNNYSLQLNMYAYMIKRNNPNLKIGKLRIIHYKFDENGEVIDSIIYNVPNLQKEVAAIISMVKTKKL